MGLLGRLSLGRRRQASGSPPGAQPQQGGSGAAQEPAAEQQADPGPPPPPPPPLTTLPPALAAAVQRLLLSSNTGEEAVAAVEVLLEAAKDPAAAAALGCDAALVGRLRDALAAAGTGGAVEPAEAPPAAWEQGSQRERLALLAAYLVSCLAGKAPAADAALLGQRLLPALVAAAAASAARCTAGAAGWGVARGALRAVAKLLEAQPALAAAQLLACGGVEEVGALLAAPDTGIARRCLAILQATAAAGPAEPFQRALLAPAPLAALVGLLGGRHRGSSASIEILTGAAALMELLSREPGSAGQLAAAGAGPALAALASAGDGTHAGTLAAQALHHLRRQGSWRAGQPGLQRAASSGGSSGGGVPLPAPARPWSQQLGRAASAPSPLPAVPEQQAVSGLGAAGRRSSTGLPAADSLAKVQRWQEQQAAAAVAGGGAAAYVGSVAGGPSVSAAHLVAALASGVPRTQLAAAEQLAALAGSGARAAAVVSAAGGGQALLACVCDSAAGPVDLSDTVQDAFASALNQSVCTAALRALCTLCQHDEGAAATLPPAAAPSLHLLLTGPDPQQRRLATMLLASMEAAAAAGGGRELLLSGRGGVSGGTPSGGASHSHSHDLLQSDQFSFLSEPQSERYSLHLRQKGQGQGQQLGLGPGPGETPTSLLHRQASGASTGSGSGRAGGARRQLGIESPQQAQQAQLGRPPLPPGGARPPSGQRQLWGPESEGSASADQLQQQQAGGGGGGAAGREGPGSPGSSAGSDGSPALRRSDIVICQDSAGADWRLGEGGFGVVYRGLMHGVDEVAVKRVKADAPSAADLDTFQREAALLARLHHRNVVQYYGHCLEPGGLLLVTELMKGGDLYGALRRHPAAFAWGRLGRKVLLDVALGLNYLHSQRPPLVHRDLKSPNVLLSEEGVAKIGDVGMVRPTGAAAHGGLATAAPLMTPLWAAPEVLRRERAGVKADIWSYGLLMWEVATGRDITRFEPLALTRLAEAGAAGGGPGAEAGGGAGGGAPRVEMPAEAPQVARHIFATCTQLEPGLRPNAQQLVEWLRGGKVCDCCAV